MSAKSRKRKTAAQFETVIDTVGAQLTDVDNILIQADQVRQNRKLALEEQRAAQQIKESKHRIKTDEYVLKLVDQKIIANNFVSIDSVRAKLLERLSQLDPLFGEGFGTQLVDELLPLARRSPGTKAVLEAYRKMKQLEGLD